MEIKNFKKFNSKGITLIALVVTIIVLLLLAGITISSLTGENGIFQNARTAKNEYTRQATNEQGVLENLAKTIDNETEEKVDNPYSDKYLEGQEVVNAYSDTDNIDKGTSGDAKEGVWWWVDLEGILHIAPINGAKIGTLGEIPLDDEYYDPIIPWADEEDCITSVIVEPGVVANQNSSYLFSSLYQAINIDFYNLDTSNVTDISYMFGWDRELVSLDLSSLQTDNVTTMRYIFSYCVNLVAIDISHFKTNNVTDMSGMFSRMFNTYLYRFNTIRYQ